jgi:hypothetical protein
MRELFRRTGVRWWGAGLLLGAGLAQAVTPAEDAGASVGAVWRTHELHFHYLGRTSRYSCDGMRDKVTALLLDLGARRDLKVTALGCEGSGSGVRINAISPSLTVKFAAPDPVSAPGEATPALRARFEPFQITSDAFRNLGMGDCELVEEFARQILPNLATLDVHQDISCVPYQTSGSRFLLKGRILRALP